MLLVKEEYYLLYARFLAIIDGIGNKLATRYCVVIILRLQPKIKIRFDVRVQCWRTSIEEWGVRYR